MIKQVCQSSLNVTQRLKVLVPIKKDKPALVTMIPAALVLTTLVLTTLVLTTLVFTTLVLVIDPDGGFGDKANITYKGVR